MAFCSKCGAQLNEGSGFCAACGAAAGQSVTPSGGAAASGQTSVATAGMAKNVAGLLCYSFGFITGVIFLVIEPYKNDRFVRFHAFQSIFYSVACIAVSMVWSFVFVGMIFSLGSLGMFSLFGLLFMLVRLAMFAGWILLMFKAYNNEEFKLPIIGDIAAKQANV